ncbi:MAG: TolC family protein, partial [Planctomycetes bacterium]|nr:TolC family protein [Planctomycetota bacterium]
RARRATLRFELLEALGLAASQSEIATDRSVPSWDGEPARLSEEALLASAAARRLDVAAAHSAVAAEEARARGARRSRIADTGAGAMYMRDDDDRKFIFPQAQVSLPLFDTGAAAIAGAEAESRRAYFEACALLQTAEREVRNARAEWAAAHDGARQSEEIWARGRRATELAALLHATGEAPRAAVLEAADTEIEAARAFSEASLRAALARIELERAIGGALPTTPWEESAP